MAISRALQYTNFSSVLIVATSRYYYTLTFTIDFPHEKDTVHIAHCYPYTFSDLQRYLSSLCADPRMKNRMRRKPLCQTLAGNTCDLITVTNYADLSTEAMAKRKVSPLSLSMPDLNPPPPPPPPGSICQHNTHSWWVACRGW